LSRFSCGRPTHFIVATSVKSTVDLNQRPSSRFINLFRQANTTWGGGHKGRAIARRRHHTASGCDLVQRAAPTTPKQAVGIERERRLHNLAWDAEVQDNIATVQLQIDEFAGRLFNEPLTPVRSDSVRAAQFIFSPAVALQGSIIGIQIDNEIVARAVGVKPINRDAHQVIGRHLATYVYYFPFDARAVIIARSKRAQYQQKYVGTTNLMAQTAHERNEPPR
jgi:hypothetical protein